MSVEPASRPGRIRQAARRAVRADFDLDLAQRVAARLFRRGAGHRVGGQQKPRGLALLQRARQDAKGVRRQMQAVRNQRGQQARLRQRVQDHVLEFRHGGRHGVAEMRPADRARLHRRAQRLAHRAGMAEEKLDLLLHARADDLRARRRDRSPARA